MFSKHVKRAAGVLAASALLIAGGTAAQAKVGPGDIYPDEQTEYFGWHQGDPNGQNSYEVSWNGLYFGAPNKAQIINGLVQKGERPDEQLTAAELIEKIETARVFDHEGSAVFQVAIFYVPEGEEVDGNVAEWTTLRPVDPISSGVGSRTISVSDFWTGTGDVGDLASAPLATLLDELNAEAYELAGYGLFSDGLSYVSGMRFDGDTTMFGYESPTRYSPSGDPFEGGVEDFELIDGTPGQDVCEAIQFGPGELGYAIDPIEVAGETVEEKWQDLAGILASLDGRYTYDSTDDPVVSGVVRVLYGVSPEDAESVSISPLGNTPDGKVWVSGNIPGLDTSGELLLGDVVHALVQNPDMSVWVDGISVVSDGEITLENFRFYDNVNLVFPGECDVEDPEDEPTEEPDPNDDPENDDSDDEPSNDEDQDEETDANGDSPKPVIVEPSYAG